MKMKKWKIIGCIVFLLICNSMYAQDPPPPPPPQPGLPVDGGITILLFAGAIYGAYKLRKK